MQGEGQVKRGKKGSEQVGTYRLESVEGLSEERERKKERKGHSHSEECRGSDKSGLREKVSE